MASPFVVRAIENNMILVRWNVDATVRDVTLALDDYKEQITSRIFDEGRRFDNNVKWYVSIRVEMKKTTLLENGEEVSKTNLTLHGKTRTLVNINADELDEQYQLSRDKIIKTLEDFVQNGSGWVLNRVLYVDLNIVRYRPLHGASSSFIELPIILAKKNALINIKNPNDQKCFLWSVLAYLYDLPGRHYRVSSYKKFEHLINMTGIQYPVKLKDIDRFERQNSEISVNVFGYEDSDENGNPVEGRVYPLRSTKCHDRQHVIHLLMLGGESRQHFHYCLINTKPGFNGMSRLLSNLTKSKKSTYYCPYCLHRFSSSNPEIAKQNLNLHISDCKEHGEQRVKMPTQQESVMKFRDYSLTLRAPFTVYADFESFIVPINTCIQGPVGNQQRTVNSVPTKSGYVCDGDYEVYSVNDLTSLKNQGFTNNVAYHVPSGYCYVIIDEDGNIEEGPVVYRAKDMQENIVEKMIDELLAHGNRLKERMLQTIPMALTDEEEMNFLNASECFLCQRQLDNDRVRHHSHTNGKYLGACHSNCNLNAKRGTHIPVFFHNLRGYDAHHIVHSLGKFKTEDVTCIANTSERFLSISLGPLRFLDSLQFTNESLENLVNNLKSNCTDKNQTFKRMSVFFTDCEKRDLLIRKGVFPYDYMTGVERFEDTCLPPPSAFYSELYRDGISHSDYNHAQSVWTKFNLNNMGEYHDLYLITDVMLLADVFENFRNLSLEYYLLDPCHFYSTPHLTWNAMLKMTNIELELLRNIDMHLFIERGTRGGVAMIPHRYARANNPEMKNYTNDQNVFDPSKPTTWIMYYDCTNLYGTAMIEPLPYGGFRWLHQVEIEEIDWCNLPADGEKGYVLEVDLEYPKELHDLHNDYPVAPERKIPPPCTLGGTKRGRIPKLLNTLENKARYVLHYRNLQYYMSLGLRLTKIHRAVEFNQSRWLKPYIEFNTEKRKVARNNFEKDFFKLMNNAVYGKSLENVRNRIDFHLVLDSRKLDRMIAKPRVKNWFVYNQDVAGVALKKTEIKLNRPIYIGFTVLDISKLIMYRFHYDYSVKRYGDKIKLLMTDTDSLMYQIETPDIFQDMKENLQLFDTSEYPVQNICYNTENLKKLGTFKDEMKGVPILEFVGLRAKMYSILDVRKIEKQVAKGVPRVSIKYDLTHNKYKESLDNLQGIYTTACGIRSGSHNIYSIIQRKLSLSPFDDKRHILLNKHDTLAYGHYLLKENPNKRKLDDGDDSPPEKMATLETLDYLNHHGDGLFATLCFLESHGHDYFW